MLALLAWFAPDALATSSYELPGGKICNGRPCVSLLDAHMEIVPGDYFDRVAREIAPAAVEWMEIELFVYSGDLHLFVEGVELDPRAGVYDERSGGTSWVVRIRDQRSFGIEVRNDSNRERGEYEVVGTVLAGN